MRTLITALNFIILSSLCFSQVETGMEMLFKDNNFLILENKKIGLITNHTALNNNMKSSLDLLIKNSKKFNYTITALFGPEHGIDGSGYAYGWESLGKEYRKNDGKIPIYSLHGPQKRPTQIMLNGINLLIFDIQDIGVRHYTYATTLFYVMEEAKKYNIPVIVADRPNPINGLTIDGPMLDDEFRSTVGYVNVPLCHGMTIGELAKFFNIEYNINCKLTVIPMKGWKREMTFSDTGLTWVPTSPQIPEHDTPIYYVTTAIIGEGLSTVSTGVGYTLPFKVVGAPWINAKKFAKVLNEQNYEGVQFQPFHFRPFFGRYKGEDCHGIRIIVTNLSKYLPVATQFLIMGILKNLYPYKFNSSLNNRSTQQKRMFNLLSGRKEVAEIMENERYIAWKLRAIDKENRKEYMKKREKYLIPSY